MVLKAAIVSNDGKRISITVNTPEAIPFETSTFRGKMLLLHRPLDFEGEDGDGSGEDDAVGSAGAGEEGEEDPSQPWLSRWHGQKRRVEFRVQGQIVAKLSEGAVGGADSTNKLDKDDAGDGAVANGDDAVVAEQAIRPRFGVEVPGPLQFSYASRCLLSAGINLLASGHGTPITVNTEYDPGTESESPKPSESLGSSDPAKATDGDNDSDKAAAGSCQSAEGAAGPGGLCPSWPSITVPLSSIHVLKATGSGAELPNLKAKYMRKTPPAEKAEVTLNSSDTFTFALWSSRLDLLRWETCNMPMGLDCYLSSIIGDRPLRLNIEGAGTSGERLTIWRLELSNSEEPEAGSSNA